MSVYTPHTDADVKKMLETIGVKDIDSLFADVPVKIKAKQLKLDEGLSQFEVLDRLREIAKKNLCFSTILRGAGAYDHFIPPVVTALANREEFVTAYTPYQAEISQGILQSIFEYQSLMCNLTGMEISNASLYDGTSAAAEAMTMCCDKKRKVALVGEINPQTIETIKTYAHASGVEVVVVKSNKGLADIKKLEKQLDGTFAAVFAQSPNYLGLIEDMDAIAQAAHTANAKMVYIFSPFAAALLKTPYDSGADIAVGEGQPLGMALSFGGPYLGIMTCRKELLRRLPGRIVGETTDHNGNRAFVLTMQAREQHIRREKATSSVCSNEALCALTAGIYLTAMGTSFIEAANECATKSHYLCDKLVATGKFEKAYKGEYFDEFTLKTNLDIDEFNKKLESEGILGGLKLNDNEMLWCVTEKPTKAVLDRVIEIAEGK
ncbi:MAG: aminomethyl-transferring glycine dehydrogenase subunit GcvPA [Clostridia bacterium]